MHTQQVAKRMHKQGSVITIKTIAIKEVTHFSHDTLLGDIAFLL